MYGGLQQLFFFSETPESVEQVAPEATVEGERLTLPLNVILLRNENNGTKRSESNVERLVERADNIWNQAKIDLEIAGITEQEVEDALMENFLEEPKGVLKGMETPMKGVKVFLLRRLEGINGIAFQGSKSLAVADITASYDFRTLAHEIGHVLGLDHMEGEGLRLMNKRSDGYIITRDEALRARDILKNLR